MILKSYAKLNLYLEVVNKRKDNYHNLKTVFERIGLCDKIILKSRLDKKIRIKCSNPHVPKDSSNLCYASAKLLQEIFNIDKGLDITITKRIPVGAGLGGGSSNAAVVLLGLNKLWNLKLSQNRLAEIAGKIGSDVAFFIYDTSFALGLGRGDEIKPLRASRDTKLWHILVVPKIAVSTPFIYKKWDEDCRLTMPKFDVKLLTPLESLTKALRRNNLFSRAELLFNSLEPVTVKYFPEVRNIKDKLSCLGLKSILMSGSGPAVFGIVSSRKEAVTISRKLKREGKSWQVFVTGTANAKGN